MLNKAADADFILKGRFKQDKKITATVIVENENQETEECIENIDNEDEEGIAYNLTGKLKLLDDMIINETTQHEEQGKKNCNI